MNTYACTPDVILHNDEVGPHNYSTVLLETAYFIARIIVDASIELMRAAAYQN